MLPPNTDCKIASFCAWRVKSGLGQKRVRFIKKKKTCGNGLRLKLEKRECVNWNKYLEKELYDGKLPNRI